MKLYMRMAEKYRQLLSSHGSRLGMYNLVSVSTFYNGGLWDLTNDKTIPSYGTFSQDMRRVRALVESDSLDIGVSAGVLSFPRTACAYDSLANSDYLVITPLEYRANPGKWKVLRVSELHSPLTWECVVVELAEDIAFR